MASASSSQTKQLTPALNVHFQMADCIIQFNNGVALLKSDQPSYKKLFEFLKKSHIYVALTKEPSAYYSQFLREFWYTAEADISSKSITFSLSHFENPLTFNLDVFSSVIRLKSSESFVNIPKKETVKEGLASLGLFDETKPSLTSFDLINSSPVKIFVSCHGTSDEGNYKNDKLLSLKPYKITAVTLRTPLKNENPLTAHMCNVVEISPRPLQYFIPPSEEVNVDDSADKSLSGTFVPPVTQSKATTARKPRKKTIPYSTRPEALNSSRIETSSSSQATHLQPAEEFVVTTDETKSLDVSESAGAQENQNETAEAEKFFQASQITKDVEVTLMGSRPMDMDSYTADSEFELESMPDDDLQSLSSFETFVSDSSHDVSHSEHTSWEKTSFA
ncbi:hypothetical protein Tco_0287702 [Tanacetum coccineum]